MLWIITLILILMWAGVPFSAVLVALGWCLWIGAGALLVGALILVFN